MYRPSILLADDHTLIIEGFRRILEGHYNLAGTATGLVNMGVMTGPMVLQPLVGWVLDRAWDGSLREGARVYSDAAWRLGFLPMVVWLGLSAVLILLTREARPARGP